MIRDERKSLLFGKMKSSFFNLSNSTSVTNLSIDYVGKYEVVYSFKNLC